MTVPLRHYPTLRSHKEPTCSAVGRLLRYVVRKCNFFRIHLAAFLVIPLVCGSILYASNGRFQVGFLDALFLCYSAMTVTGLSTVNLSTTTAWQQFILYFLMAIGHMTTSSWIMVMVRKHYFRTRCEYVASAEQARRTRSALSISAPLNVFLQRQPVHFAEDRKDILDAPAVDSQVSRVSSAMADGSSLSALQDEPSVSRPRSSHSPVAPFIARTSGDIQTYSAGGPLDTLRLSPPLEHSFWDSVSTSPSTVTLGVENELESPDLNNRSHKSKPKMLLQGLRKVSWLKFDGLVVGRNSDFHTESLTDEQIEELGGVEYRALKLLSYWVPVYFICTQLFSYLLFAPWLSTRTDYDEVFAAQPRLVQKPWFSLFQVMGAYTGGGLSLVDMGMAPFRGAYLMIASLSFVILAGNHAFPVFLRFSIWIGYKLFPRGSRIHEIFEFLLDHPRRCFLYMFPSHQTWFLVFCLVVYSAFDWIAFEVLDLGLPLYESYSLGEKIAGGIFQGLASRASGLPIIAIANLAPAVQFLYIISMYIAVYPMVLCIRSSNVYEEHTLGVFGAVRDDEKDYLESGGMFGQRRRIGRYIGWHLRRQLSMDIWWLVWAVFVIAIIERRNIMDEAKPRFDMFHIFFELVSAFGGIGLSLGLPNDNFSFSGGMQPLSKIVVIIIMVRGRHRELPLALDRAVLLPHEMVVRKDTPAVAEPSNKEVVSEHTPPDIPNSAFQGQA